MTVDWQTNTTGRQNCGDMFATIEVFEYGTDVYVGNVTLNSTEVGKHATYYNEADATKST